MTTVELICPVPRGSRRGNRITALRWAAILRQLGHRVRIRDRRSSEPADVVIALHALKTHDSVIAAAREQPRPRIVVALTGTDLYDSLAADPRTLESLEIADRIVALHPGAGELLPPPLRERVRVIVQSARSPGPPPTEERSRDFVCTLIGHLRPVKDPFLVADALARLPETSTARVEHIGDALASEMADRARRLTESEPRYRWLGPLPRCDTLRRLQSSRLLLLTSRAEGGANVISEALACDVPVLATRIPSTVGLLGAGYPGLFEVGDAADLAAHLARLEEDEAHYAKLTAATRARRDRFDPAEERRAWRELLAELRSM